MLLDEIIDVAIGNAQPLTVLLRKCLLLAHYFKNERLKIWVNQELNGYPTDVNLPEYRLVGAGALGDFSGYGGSGLKNWPIPPALLEEQHREYAETVYLKQAIGAYEDFISKGNGSIYYQWSANLVLYYQSTIRNNKGMVLVAARQHVPLSSFAELLVRCNQKSNCEYGT